MGREGKGTGVRGRRDGVGKGGKGKEGRGGEYRHFFLYTLSTALNRYVLLLMQTGHQPLTFTLVHSFMLNLRFRSLANSFDHRSFLHLSD